MGNKTTYNELEKRIKELETELAQRSHALGERIKELNCLYGLSKLVEKENISLDDILNGTVNLIPPSWQYPEITCAGITYNKKVFKTANMRVTEWVQSCEIIVYDKIVGLIEVFYLEKMPVLIEGPFLKEERNLINALAERLGKIIERSLTEAELKKSEEKYRHLFKYANDSIYIVEPETGKLMDCNDNAAKHLGYTKEEILELTFKDIDTPMKHEKFVAIVEEMKLKKHVVFEHAHRRKDGTELPVEISSHIINLGGKEVYQSFVRDISERKIAETELLRQKDFLNTVIDSLSHPFYVINADNYDIEMTNTTFKNYYGNKLGTCYYITHGFNNPCNNHGYSCPIKLIRNLKKPITTEHVNVNADGTKQYLEIHSFPLFDEYGEVKQVIEYFLDITGRKELEDKVNRLRREYEAFLRHELMNRLTPILGYSNLMKGMKIGINEKFMAYVNKIYQSTEYTIKLVDSIKKLQDIENGNYILNKNKYNLEDIIKNRLTDLQFLINEAKVKIIFENNTENTLIEFDNDLMPGVFHNLIKNAIEHVSKEKEDSEKVIKINMQNVQDKVIITINNKGRIISKEKLFTFFEKFNSDFNNKSGGMGLGTTYAYLVTKAHGGDISVESTIEKGTNVTLKFNIVS